MCANHLEDRRSPFFAFAGQRQKTISLFGGTQCSGSTGIQFRKDANDQENRSQQCGEPVRCSIDEANRSDSREGTPGGVPEKWIHLAKLLSRLRLPFQCNWKRSGRPGPTS